MPTQDAQSPSKVAEDDKLLLQYAILMHDIKALDRALPSFYKNRISPLLPELTVDDSNTASLEGKRTVTFTSLFLSADNP